MPLKVVVGRLMSPDVFEKDVDVMLKKVEEDFIAFNKQHKGKQAQVSRSVTFHVTESHLVCILYYSWNLVEGSSGLLVPSPGPRNVG